MIGERRRRHFVGRCIELLHEIDGGLVPYGDHPVDLLLPAIAVDLAVLLLVEFNLVTILQIGNVTPRRLAHLFLLFGRCGHIRCTLLELDRVCTCMRGRIDDLLRDIDVAVVIDTHLCDDIRRMTVAQFPIPKLDLTGHSYFSLSDNCFKTISHNSRTAPWPPFFVRTKSAARNTSG